MIQMHCVSKNWTWRKQSGISPIVRRQEVLTGGARAARGAPRRPDGKVGGVARQLQSQLGKLLHLLASVSASVKWEQ